MKKKIILLSSILSCFCLNMVFAQIIDSSRVKSVIDTGKVSNLIDTLSVANASILKIQEKKEGLIVDSAKTAQNIETLEKQKREAIASEKQKIEEDLSKARRELAATKRSLSNIKNQLEDESNKLKSQIEALKNETKNEAAKFESLKSAFIKDTLDLAQKKNKLSEDTTKLQDEIKAFKIDIEKQKSFIASQKDSMQVIAEICMKDSAQLLNKTDGALLGYVEIEEIHVKVQEGIIIEIIVKTPLGSFRNENATIDLINFQDRTSDFLSLDRKSISKDSIRVIRLGDVISYAPFRSYKNIPYSEFSITLHALENKKCFLLKESTSINSYVNIAAFTDLKGISGEPNGIAQFTADLKFITRTRNFSNSGVVLFNHVSFQGAYSKFDNDFKGTAFTGNDSVSRIDFLQRSSYSIGLKGNIIRVFESPKPRHLFEDMQVNIGYNFIGSRLMDTSFADVNKTVIDTSYKLITQNHLYLEPQATLSRHKNLSMKISLPLHMINIKKSAGIRNDGWEFWASPSILLMYYNKVDQRSKLFLRYNHFINLKDSRNAFSQMQLGYSVNLTDAWSGKGD